MTNPTRPPGPATYAIRTTGDDPLYIFATDTPVWWGWSSDRYTPMTRAEALRQLADMAAELDPDVPLRCEIDDAVDAALHQTPWRWTDYLRARRLEQADHPLGQAPTSALLDELRRRIP